MFSQTKHDGVMALSERALMQSSWAHVIEVHYKRVTAKQQELSALKQWSDGLSTKCFSVSFGV